MGYNFRFGYGNRKLVPGGGLPGIPELAALYSGGALAYLPPVLENPVEPGVGSVVGQPGTGLEPVVAASFSHRQYDTSTDVMITATAGQLAGARTGNFFLTGGRRAAIFGADFSPVDGNVATTKCQFGGTREQLYLERCILDKGNTNNSLALIDDVWYITGATEADVGQAGPGSVITIQQCRLIGGRGSNRLTATPVALSNIAVVSGKVRLTTTGAHGLTLGQVIHLSNTTVDGANNIDQQNNFKFYVSAIPTTTTFELGTYRSGYEPVIVGTLGLAANAFVWPRSLAAAGAALNVVSITMQSATTARVVVSGAHGLNSTNNANEQIRIAGTTNALMNIPWLFSASVNTTTFDVVIPPLGTAPVAPATVATGGTAQRYNYPVGTHSDCIQIGSANNNKVEDVRIDKLTLDGNYQLIICGATHYANGDVLYGNEELHMSRVNGRRNDLQPRDPEGSSLLYVADTAGVRAAGDRVTDETQFREVWITPLPGKNLSQGGFSPGPLTTSDGLPMGFQTRVDAGIRHDWFTHPNFDGVIREAVPPGGDFVTAGMTGHAAAAPTYSNDTAPDAAQITALALSNQAVTTDLVRGSYLYNNNALPSFSGAVGIASTTNTLARGILDITLTDDAAGKFSMIANRLVRGKEPLTVGTFDLDFLVTVRGTGVTKAFLNVPITVTAGTAPGDVNAETTTLMGYRFAPPAPGSARRDAIDDLIGALKAAGLWADITTFYVGAQSDKRDTIVDWKAPSTNDLILAGGNGSTTMTFVADRGYNGISNASYLTKTAGFTQSELGIPQNTVTMVVGASLQDGNLPTGTDYLMGNDALYLAIATTGKITGRVNGTTTFTQAGTAFTAANTNLKYVGVVRSIGTAFDLYFGEKGTDFSAAPTEAAIANNSNVLATTTTNQMRIHSKSPDQSVNRKRISFAVTAKIAWTPAQMNSFRVAMDAFLTHLGIS